MATLLTVHRALLALPHLVQLAESHDTITYGELAQRMRVPNPRTLAWPLWYIRDEICRKRKLPMITAIVVTKGTGLPGAGFLPEGTRHLTKEQIKQRFEEIRDEVFAYPGWQDLLREAEG